MSLIFSEIYKRGLYCSGSKHVTHYGPRLGFLYYNLTTISRELSTLSTTQGRAESEDLSHENHHQLNVCIS